MIVENPTDLPVLIYEGEQIKGAQQNRSFDTSIIVPAKSGIPVPVSCIEQGRWDGGRAQRRTSASPTTRPTRPCGGSSARPQTAPAATAGPTRVRSGMRLALASSEFSVASRTDSLEDLFEMRSHRIEELKRPIKLAAEQIGAVVEISGRPVALDLVSRPEVYAALAPALNSGYAMQAAEAEPTKPDDERAARFLVKAAASRRELVVNYGLGHAFTVSRKRLVGAGVEHDGELIALSAFPRELAA